MKQRRVNIPAPGPLGECSSEDDEQWRSTAVGIDAEDDTFFVASTTNWHSDLSVLREQVRGAGKGTRENLAHIREWQFRQRRTWDPTHSRAHPVKTSAATAARALAFANSLLHAAEARGFSAGLDLKTGQFFVEAFETRIHFAVRERFDRVLAKKLEPLDEYLNRSVEVGTGRLFVAVFRSYDYRQTTYQESSVTSLLEHIRSVFAYLYAAVVWRREKQREEVRARERQAVVRAELARIEATRKEEQAAKAEVERLAAVGRQKEEALAKEAADWRIAETIRAYLSALGEPHCQSGRDWLLWAAATADRIDPLPARRALLEQRAADESTGSAGAPSKGAESA